MATKEHDVIISREGNGDYTTLADAESAYDAGPYMAYVKMGHYAPGAALTIDSDSCVWVFESGTYFDSAITVSGNQVVLMLGSGCNIAGLVTLSGTGCSLVCENGVDLDGLVISGARSYVTGGGWDTISDGAASVDGIQITAADCIVENIAAQTTAGGAATIDGISIEAARNIINMTKIVDTDQDGISVVAAGTDCTILGSVVLDADEDGIVITGPRARTIGNHVASGAVGIHVEATGDDSSISSNIIQQSGATSALTLDANGDNCVIVGNRTDGAITDNSTGSTVANNDATAF